MTPEKIERLEGLLAAATAGPWQHYNEVFRPQFGQRRVTEIQRRDRKPIVNWSGFDGLPPVTGRKANANAALIVEAINALPELLASLKEAREALEQAAADFQDLADLARNRIDDGDDQGSNVWRLALQDIGQEAVDNQARALKALGADQ